MTAAAKASAAANFIFKTGQEAAEGPGEGNCDGSLSTTRPTTLRDRERCHLPEPSGDIMSKHHPTSAYGRRITELRERVGITQSALARVLRVQPSAVNHIEAGRALPCSDRLRALAAALHVRVEAVMP